MNPSPAPLHTVKRICLDATETYWSGLHTGIQRVVRSIAARNSLIAKRTGCACVPFICTPTFVLNADRLLQKSGGKHPDTVAERLLPRIAAWADLRLRSVFGTRSPLWIVLRAMWRPIRAPFSHHAARKVQAWARTQEAVTLNPDDLLVLTDAFWGHWGAQVVPLAERASEQGAPVILCIYDLFPLTRPELVDPDNVALFKRHFPAVLRTVCGIVTISHAMAREVREYLAAHHPGAAEIPVEVFHLGQDVPRRQSNDPRSLRAELAELIGKRRYYLAVGTLEPRKGYANLLDAFDQRWRTDDTVALCIVGKVGWQCWEELSRIQSSAHRGKRLFFFNDVSDDELHQLYAGSQAIVMPSLAEGFGLPLVEAMGAGARVIANDIPIFREIAGDYALYYSRTGENLKAAIDEMERRIAQGWRPPPKSWLTWDQATLQFADAILRILDRRGIPQPLSPGEAAASA
jgi:alpha-1,2-rhamnosyltransferase